MSRCGFKIGGGIDQDFTKSPQGYTDYGKEYSKEEELVWNFFFNFKVFT